MSAKAPDFKDGDLIPGTKYRIVRQIGAGGMGVVYQVVKPPEIQGVLKLMSSDLTAHQEFRTRFLDEVRVLAQIDHPNIVKVFDYDTLPDGTPFYVMELLHGRTVRDVLATMGTFPPRVAFEVTRQLCEALHCAHTHDIPVIHRDIKPENIFLHAPRHGEPVVKLIDFGVVAVADRQHDGTFVGTWKYAAPEQIRGERATPATDLYAVGLVLYEMLCGIGPFEHLDSGSLVSQAHLREIPPPVSKFAPWVPPSIVELISSALAKEPRQRPRDAYLFAERLFELEWANDGKDPNDRTSEGPLSRILSTAGGANKPAGKNMVAGPPRDRLGNVPVVGVPGRARHGGPTIRGMGGNTLEGTSPGEDTLLAGLGARADAAPRSNPRSKQVRDAGPEIDAAGQAGQVILRANGHGLADLPGAIAVTPKGPPVVLGARAANVEVPTLDAPPSAPKLRVSGLASGAPGTGEGAWAEAQTLRRAAARSAGAATIDSDTLGAQESDAQRAPRRTGKLAVPIALALVVVIGAVSFAAYRGSGPSAQGGSAVGNPRAATATAATAAATAATAPTATASVTVGTEETSAVAPPPPPPAPGASGASGASKPPTSGVRGGKGPGVSTRVVTPSSPASPASPPGSMPAASPAATAGAEAPKKPAPAGSSKDESFLRGL